MNDIGMNDHRTDDYGALTASDTVRIERLLPGPIERVWTFLTDSEKRARWLAAGDMELRVGGKVEHVFNNTALTGHDGVPPAKYAKHNCATMQGRITACEPPRLLSYTWGEESDVRFDLTPRGDKVLLVVTHRRLAPREMILSVAAGWHTHLDILRDRLADRTPEGFWAKHTRLEAEYDKRLPAR